MEGEFIKNGATSTLTRLPPGFRFQPTDEELLFQYLKRKIFSLPLPASIIPEVNVWAYDPWNLPGGDQADQETKYFFCNTGPKCGSSINNGRIRANNTSGFWRDCSVVHRFFPSSSEDLMIMGRKKSMVYHKVTGLYNSRTDWIMDVYSLIPAPPTNYAIPSQDLGVLLEKWVICGVARKKTSCSRNSGSSNSRLASMPMEVEEEPDSDDDYDAADDYDTSSSSSSSSITTTDDVVSSSSSTRHMYIR